MLKLILLVAGIWLIYRLLKGYSRSVQDEQPPPEVITGGDMVRCVQCGVHFPRSEGILSRGEFFCSDEHRKLHQH